MEADVYEGFAERLAAKYQGHAVTVIHDGEHIAYEVANDHPAAKVLHELVNAEPLTGDQEEKPTRPPLRQRGDRVDLTKPFLVAGS